MADLEFYTLGTNPEEEAIRTQQLYFDRGVDEFVREEFESTVHAYTTLLPDEIALRIQSRYTGDHPVAHGLLPVYRKADIGMAIWGEKDFQNVDSREETPGINVSAWLLKQYRNQGFGRRVIEHATAEAVTLSEQLGKQVWTSIRPDNLASRRACEHAGFIEAGSQPDKPERLLYILQVD